MAKKPSKGAFPKGAPQPKGGAPGSPGFMLNPKGGMSKPTTPKR